MMFFLKTSDNYVSIYIGFKVNSNTSPHQKRFYTRGTLRSIRILKLATIYRDWLRNQKKVNYFSCIEWKGW